MSELREGDIYHWRWADEAQHADNAPYRSYHCKSQLAVVKGGKLYDTYWGTPDYPLEPERVSLTLLCNSNEWEEISSYRVVYYDRSDIVDTRHANNSRAPIYLRPGAKRSQTAILEELAHREEQARSAIRSAEWQLDDVMKYRALVEADKLDEVIL